MGLVVMLADALSQPIPKGAYIRVDILDSQIGLAVGAGSLVIFWRGFIGAYVLYPCWFARRWSKALDAHEYGDVTNMIEIPVWIAYGAISVGMGLFILVLVLQLALQLRQGWADYE